ncbi:MAG: LysR family transcriptional regulator [Candidatus Dactylopiibacterium sp.]|nr:LysR family transcriptional regulator [Candidatus Dactylopiibacterium sp.]
MSFSSDALEVFVATLDHGSFSAAARALGRVPSAVSMAIGNLEAECGLTLFARNGREPVPTAAARSLAPQARELVMQLRELRAQALALSTGQESQLSIAIAPELLGGDWAAQLARLAAEYPALTVEVLAAPQEDALRMLHGGRVQLALVFERQSFDGREGFEEVRTETLVPVIAPHHPACSAGAALRTEMLAGHRQIVVAGREQALSDSRLLFSRHYWRTDNPESAIRLIGTGLGWGFLPHARVRAQLESGELVELHLANATTALRLWVDVVWSREHPLGPAARRFVALMGEAPPA